MYSPQRDEYEAIIVMCLRSEKKTPCLIRRVQT